VAFHHHQLRPIAAGAAQIAQAAAVPVALHLDHVQDAALLHQAADAGMSSVMFDASALDYADNIAATRAAAQWAHAHGLWLEAELGEVGGKDGAHAPGVRTDPAEAAAFTAATGADALAVAVGSSHAMTTQTARLDHALITRLAGSVPVPLVLHGSSGVPDGELAQAVRHGIVKVNIGTAVNVALTGAIRMWLSAHPDTVDPRKYLAPARDQVAAAVTRLITVVAAETDLRIRQKRHRPVIPAAATVAAIVESHHGTVQVTSRPGRTAFIVRLPLLPGVGADCQ
jgi:fructose-bisphosphate aldolase, class II